MTDKRRVVVAGVGAVTALGYTGEALWQNLLAGKSGISKIEAFDASAYPSQIAGEVKDFDPIERIGKKESRRLDRFAQFALVAADVAIEDSGLDFENEDRARIGSILGSGIGGLQEILNNHMLLLERGPHRVSPLLIPKLMSNAAPGQISLKYGLGGPNWDCSTACASAANAMGDSFRLIQLGLADIMITGGAEATITGLAVAGFCVPKALSTRNDEPEKASRPFDRDRDGFVIAEGAGVLVFEELEHAKARNARIYAEVVGLGATADAYHITAPDPEGKGAARAMAAALEDARLNPEDVDYINAHGTSTIAGDPAETKAIKHIFGHHAKKVAISSTKSMLGHQLGASGGPELIACCMAVCNDCVSPTVNLENPDPECDLDYVPNEAREMPVRYALSNSFGFGGHNAAIAVGKVS